MYSNYKSVQLIISVLKTYNIRHIVLSPGGSDVPIIHSIETDPFFTCYSVVDERSAVYFGIGVSQSHNEPVACVCTSGTAASNYLPGITEAFYQNIPIVAITADKDPYFQGQLQTQKIDQQNIFDGVINKSVSLPICYNEKELWYCERLIKEAIIATFQHGWGPVHINVPIVGDYNNYNTKELPSIRKVNIVTCESESFVWDSYRSILENAKKMLIVIGQNIVFSNNDIRNIEYFFEHYNCVIAVEHLSNLKCRGCVFSYRATEIGLIDDTFTPDVVVSIGNNLASYGLKPFLRRNHKKIRHIAIDLGGRYRDVYQCIQDIFECNPSTFFNYYAKDAKGTNDKKYYNQWKSVVQIEIGELPYSSLYVGQQLAKIIPPNSLLHTSILNSTRIMQFFDLADGVKCYSNVGALGIDGCFSTFAGMSTDINCKAFLVIGDLSFFYDMNAAGIRHLGKNVRIVLLNNGGGSEFHFFLNKQTIPTLDQHICAEHTHIAKGWVESLGFKYYAAHNKIDVDIVMKTFADDSDSPKLLEVFTDMELDASTIRDFFYFNRPKHSKVELAVNKVKKVVKLAIGKE